jgi:hypothetical protein
MEFVGEPRIVPTLADLAALPTPLNGGEAAVLQALARLAPDWSIFVQPRLAMAQPDFVVVHPEKGVWIIEVKDWNPQIYRGDGVTGGRWIEVFDGQRWVRRVSPRKQVVGYEKVFRERFFVDFTDVWVPQKGLGVLLVLPQFSREDATELMGGFPLVSGDDLDVLADLLMLSENVDMDRDHLADLLRWMDEPENVSDQRLPLILSGRALEVANNPRGVALRRVRGPAGSGKSLALASRAIVLAGEGNEVLIVTFNITLGHYLNDLCARAARQRGVRHWNRFVSITHFHGLLSELMEQRGESGGEGAWEPRAIGVLRRAYAEGDDDLPTYDAILVDEGQDFEREWWQFLRTCLLRPRGEMLLVADPTQNIFQRSQWADSGTAGGGFSGPWFELQGTYRMPVDLVPIVVDFARAYLPGEDRVLPTVENDHPGLRDAHKVTHRRWVNVAEGDVVDATADEVTRLLEADPRLSPSDIVLLTDHEVGVQIMEELHRRGNDVLSMFTPFDGEARRRRKRAFWAGTPGVKGCTVHSFKGWESKAVVCVPVVMGETQLYIAMTRVKSAPSRSAYLTVVNAVDNLRGFKPRFEREVLPSEVPALAGQVTFDL